MNKTMAAAAMTLMAAVPAHACNAGMPSFDCSGIAMVMFAMPLIIGTGVLVMVGLLNAIVRAI